jgi:hypothetical protein
MRLRNATLPTIIAVLFLAGAAAGVAREQEPIEKFTAFAASLGTGKAGVVEIGIYRWSTLVELHIDKNGKGEGKIVPAAKVTWDKDAKRIEIENYNALPVDLLQVFKKTP